MRIRNGRPLIKFQIFPHSCLHFFGVTVSLKWWWRRRRSGLRLNVHFLFGQAECWNITGAHSRDKELDHRMRKHQCWSDRAASLYEMRKGIKAVVVNQTGKIRLNI